LFAYSNKFSCEESGIFGSLLGLGGVALSAAGCLDYEGFGLVLGDFEVRNITIEFPCILSYELIAFPDLHTY
jgi:hypothetical protein